MSNTTDNSLLKDNTFSSAKFSPMSMKENALDVPRDSFLTPRNGEGANYYYYTLPGEKRDRKEQAHRDSDGKAVEEYYNRKKASSDEYFSSIESSANLAWMKKNVLTRLKRTIKLIGCMQVL